ncbi:hypothetical protein RRSWK_04215 [Rhodopirellula sp. SWK7]|nr:hypothetical protein RRSWK_04215 [Rhodopirellula sp. SWK7]
MRPDIPAVPAGASESDAFDFDGASGATDTVLITRPDRPAGTDTPVAGVECSEADVVGADAESDLTMVAMERLVAKGI